MEKVEKTGLSMKPSLRSRAQPVVDRSYRGNFSAYISDLVERNLDGEPIGGSPSPRVLEELADTYAGFLQPTFSEQLAERKINQRRLLHDVLVQVADFLATGAPLEDMQIGSRRQYEAGARAIARPAAPDAPAKDYRHFMSPQTQPVLNEPPANPPACNSAQVMAEEQAEIRKTLHADTHKPLPPQSPPVPPPNTGDAAPKP